MYGGQPKTRKSVYGTVTKMFGNFGYVDDEIFFLRTCVSGAQPRVGDRVYVSAVYTPDMPVKWNAERLEIQGKQPPPAPPQQQPRHQQQPPRRPQPPPHHGGGGGDSRRGYGGGGGGGGSGIGVKRGSASTAAPAASSSSHQRQASYTVSAPNRLLALPQFSAMELRQRCPRLYLPSDFFHVSNAWLDAFPIDQPFQLGRECAYHVFPKEVDSLEHKEEMEAPEPADQDYRYSAKVMLLSGPALDQLYSRTCALAQDTPEVRNRCQSVQKTLQFLCGVSGGKSSEPLALGGPWSPSADGEDPEGDPQVLINTAVRHVRRLIGLDLSGCTSWCRFTEYRYYRPARSEKQRPATVETVVLYLPDAWNLMPGCEEDWQVRQKVWVDRLESLLNPRQPTPPPPTPPPAPPAPAEEEDPAEATATTVEDVSAVADATDGEDATESGGPAKKVTAGDLPAMKVADLRAELERRGLNGKGLKAQLVSRLEEALKSETAATEEEVKEEEETETAPAAEAETPAAVAELKTESAPPPVPAPQQRPPPPTPLPEAEKTRLRRSHQLPRTPALLVTPSRTARGGKLDCQLMTLSQLLAYRLDANREHTFEVSLFAEQFNDMLTRDCAFNVLAALERKSAARAKDKKAQENGKSSSSASATAAAADADSEEQPPLEKRPRHDAAAEHQTAPLPAAAAAQKQPKRTFRPDLLISFAYFDRDLAGYLLCRDLEDLLHSLGTLRSRYQVRRLAEAFGEKRGGGSSEMLLRYRCLTDFEAEPEGEGEDDDDAMKAQLLATGGNRDLLPTSSAASAAVVVAPGADADAVESRLRRAEAARDAAASALAAAACSLSGDIRRLAAAQADRAAADAECRRLREAVRALKREEATQRRALADHRALVRATSDALERARQPLFDLFAGDEASAPSANSSGGVEQPKNAAAAAPANANREWNVVDSV